MELNYAMSYRITTLEIEQAAIRAERARMAAEHPDMIVRRDGILRRVLRRPQNGRTVAAPATVPAPTPGRAAAAVATAAPVAVPEVGRIAELVPASSASADDRARAGELVGCGTSAA